MYHVDKGYKYHFGFTTTVCPKVPYKSKVPLFIAKCGWILKSFGLLIALAGRFVFVV